MCIKRKKYATPIFEVTLFKTENSVMAPFETTSEYESMTEIDNPASGDWDDW